MKKTLLAVALATASLAAYADSITTLHNTGAGLNAGDADANYMLNSNPGVVASNAYPLAPAGSWVANSGTSQWISATADAAATQPAGNYTWTTMFDLGAYDPTSASFSGFFAADDSVTDIMLNTTHLTLTAPGTYSAFTGFGATSGFVAGSNTLSFVVNNTGGPSGLRVEFDQTSVSMVPEPETYGMLLAGLGLMGFLARRRKA